MNYTVKDLMVPISDYATIPQGATLLEAVLALENAKVVLDNTIYPHWLVLVLDNNQKVIGKLSQLNALRALDPKTDGISRIDQIRQYGFSNKFITAMREEYRPINRSLEDVYTDPIIMSMKVEDFMKSIAESEFIDQDTSLDTAVHQMSLRNRLSLLVTQNTDVIGILRLSDVFTAVINAIKRTL